MSSDELNIPSSQILVNEKTKIQKPKLFKVILLMMIILLWNMLLNC